ncbi:hypothetical protein LCGC14_1528480 [marine sediment metagenome]|uniref:Uncharacterized protein n=1 Tax=marine sediment metagenome TaxID=412755 RepID=A0A0F9LXK2_9ZZZZ
MTECYERWRQQDGTVCCPMEEDITHLTTEECEACQSEFRGIAWELRVRKACGVRAQDIDLHTFPWWEVLQGGDYLGGNRGCRDL